MLLFFYEILFVLFSTYWMKQLLILSRRESGRKLCNDTFFLFCFCQNISQLLLAWEKIDKILLCFTLLHAHFQLQLAHQKHPRWLIHEQQRLVSGSQAASSTWVRKNEASFNKNVKWSRKMSRDRRSHWRLSIIHSWHATLLTARQSSLLFHIFFVSLKSMTQVIIGRSKENITLVQKMLSSELPVWLL